MRVSGEEIHVLNGGGKRAERLDAVHAERDVPAAKLFADALEIDAPPGDEMTGGERDQPGVLIHLPDDIDLSDVAELADVHQADLRALLREGHPWIDVRRIVVVVDEDVVTLAKGQSVGHEAEAERGRADECDFIRLRVQERGGGLACLLDA